MGMPKSFTSWERAIMHPSLLERTATGSFASLGLNTLSQEQKKLLQSTNAKIGEAILNFMNHISYYTPYQNF